MALRPLVWVLVVAGTLNGAEPGTVVRLRPEARRAPVPALKYQLLPEVREMKPGNAAQWYVRCFAEQTTFFFFKESIQQRARYQAMPLAELPAKKLRDSGRSPMAQADWAARLDTIDWQVLENVQRDGFDLSLSELTPLQELAAALHVRLRAEIAERRFDDAVSAVKTMFAFARHLGEHPTEVAGSIGLTVADLAAATLEEMVSQPGCPNLYWALSDLPCPLVNLRRGAQGSRAQVDTELRRLKDSVPMSETELEELISRLSTTMSFAREQVGQAPRSWRGRLRALAADDARVAAAQSRLVESGRVEAQLRQLPRPQIILLDEKRDFEVRRDEMMKLLPFAPWQIDAMTAATAGSKPDDALLAELLPNVIKNRRVQARFERRIALLQHVEALRLYAADHAGKLPSKLDEITVPLPVDPFTGKQFQYKVVSEIAHLGGGISARDGEPALIHYEVGIRH